MSKSINFLLAGIFHVAALVSLAIIARNPSLTLGLVCVALALLAGFTWCAGRAQNEVFVAVAGLMDSKKNQRPQATARPEIYSLFAWTLCVMALARLAYLPLTGPHQLLWWCLFVLSALVLWWACLSVSVSVQQWRTSYFFGVAFCLVLWKKKWKWLGILWFSVWILWLPWVVALVDFAGSWQRGQSYVLAFSLVILARGLAMSLASSYLYLATVAKPTDFSVQLLGEAGQAADEAVTKN